MKRKTVIELLEHYEAVNYYTFRFIDEEITEFDKFYEKYDVNEAYIKDFEIIIEALNQIGEKGAIDRRFRPEGGRIKALPLETSKLRLYFFKISECIVIVGNGGHKKTKAYQEDPLLNEYVSNLREVGRHLINRITHSTKTNIFDCQIFGDMTFEIDTEIDSNEEGEK
ncbi:MAG: hypothetical protein M0D57_21145 [Sphingobacteriales bacterium JAD_PAG50586_3]|nr:MAG: hypothetical protein M0D57_21145 [Sphingobacteriales bacterium JAD_PAG50586_3]